MILSYKDLRKREVVNIADGRSFGKITDLKIEFLKGLMKGIVVCDRKNSGILCLFRKNEIYIEDKNIVRIGGDVILVNIKGANCIEPTVVDMKKGGSDSDKKSCYPPCPPKPHLPPCPPKPPCPPLPPCPPVKPKPPVSDCPPNYPLPPCDLNGGAREYGEEFGAADSVTELFGISDGEDAFDNY